VWRNSLPKKGWFTQGRTAIGIAYLGPLQPEKEIHFNPLAAREQAVA
jgi:hypothetical protein